MSSVVITNTWPDSLPLPYIDASGSPQHAILVGGAEDAKVERRLRFSGRPAAMSVTWVLNIAQYIAFKTYFLTTLNNGVSRFALELRFPKTSELTEWVVHFQGGFEARYLDGNWEVSAQLFLVMPTLLIDAVPVEGYTGFLVDSPEDNPFTVTTDRRFLVQDTAPPDGYRRFLTAPDDDQFTTLLDHPFIVPI